MDLRLATCIHGRIEITKAFLWHIDYLREVTGFELALSVCYSDPKDLEALKDEIHLINHLTQYENQPLSNKWNHLMYRVLKETSEKHIMQLGSDDFLNPDYVSLMAQNDFDHAGVNEFIVYSPQRKKATMHKMEGLPFKLTGGGRVLSRKALKKVFNNGQMYDKGLSSGLDNNSEFNLNLAGFKPVLVEFENAFIDVKSEGNNIHGFDEFAQKEFVYLELIEQLIPHTTFKCDQ